jgi:putative ABC transport system permease protein
VTASLARALWPGENPVGKVFWSPGTRFGRTQVAGVTADFVFGSFSRSATGVVLTTSDRAMGVQAEYIVRAADPGALGDTLRRAVKEAMPGSRWVRVATGREIIAADLGRQRLGAWFFSGFGFTALVLGLGGVFGLTAYLAESRRREFGVRLALGATPGDLIRHGVRTALLPVAFGVGAGLVLAACVARLFTSLLAGLSALDPLTYALVALTLLGCAALAGLGGAWRVRRLAPMAALRAE